MPTRGMCHEYRSYDRTLLRGQVCAARAWNFKLDLARLASRAGTSFSPREEFIFSPPRDPESIYSWLFAAAVPREIFFFRFMDLEFTSKSRTSLTSSSFCWLYFWKHSRSCNRDPLLRDDHDAWYGDSTKVSPEVSNCAPIAKLDAAVEKSSLHRGVWHCLQR